MRMPVSRFSGSPIIDSVHLHVCPAVSASVLVHGVTGLDTLTTPLGKAGGKLGGSAPYAALGARLFCTHVDMVSLVGEDFPARYEEALRERGINLEATVRLPGETFAWEAEYEADMNNRTTLSTKFGVLKDWKLDLPERLRRHKVIIATNVTPAHQLDLIGQCENRAFVMSDYMASWITSDRADVEKVIALSDLVLMNDSEARLFAGTSEPLAAAECLLDHGARYVVVKHGAYGATLVHRTAAGEEKLFRCPAWPLKRPVDPTGAGDTVLGPRGGDLAQSLAGGDPDWQELKRGIAYASVVAASVCESFGPDALFALTRQEVERRMLQFSEMTCWTLAGK